MRPTFPSSILLAPLHLAPRPLLARPAKPFPRLWPGCRRPSAHRAWHPATTPPCSSDNVALFCSTPLCPPALTRPPRYPHLFWTTSCLALRRAAASARGQWQRTGGGGLACASVMPSCHHAYAPALATAVEPRLALQNACSCTTLSPPFFLVPRRASLYTGATRHTMPDAPRAS